MSAELNLSAMRSNLNEAMADLEHLEDRIHFLRTGEVRGCFASRLGYQERRLPISEYTLQNTLEHSIRHLNWMWNERKMTDDELKAGSPSWTQYCPVGILPQMVRGFSPMYLRYKMWKAKQKGPRKLVGSLADLVSRAILIDPWFQLEGVERWNYGKVFYPDFNERVRYCREHQPGWEDVAESVGEALREAAYWRWRYFCDQYPQVKTAIENGDPKGFFRQLGAEGFRFSRQWLRLIVDEQGWDLLARLIRRSEELFKVIEPRRLLFGICADGRFKDKVAAKLVRMLERRCPGIVAKTVDIFGDTPLWYTLYRYQHGGKGVAGSLWQHENMGSLARVLKALGCDPDRKNKMGLSWRMVKCRMKP